jgi:hypothetical protein
MRPYEDGEDINKKAESHLQQGKVFQLSAFAFLLIQPV